jgi:hypothetical protein
VQVNNNMQAAPNIANETYPGYRNPGQLHRRLRRLSDGHRRAPPT